MQVFVLFLVNFLFCFSFQYVEHVCSLANEKMRENSRRIERFENEFEALTQKRDSLREMGIPSENGPLKEEREEVKKKDRRCRKKRQDKDVKRGLDSLKEDEMFMPGGKRTDSINSNSVESGGEYFEFVMFDDTR